MENSPFQRRTGLAEPQAQAKNRKERYEDFVVPEDPVLNLEDSREKRMFVFGVARNRLLQAIKSMNAPVSVVRDLKDADMFLTQRRYYRDRLQPIVDAETKGLPIFVIRSNSMPPQIEQFLADTFGLATPQENVKKTTKPWPRLTSRLICFRRVSLMLICSQLLPTSAKDSTNWPENTAWYRSLLEKTPTAT